MRRYVLPSILLIAVGTLAPGVSGWAVTLSPDLEQRIARLRVDETVPVILTLQDRVDLGAFRGGRAGARHLIAALRNKASQAQAPVLALLRDRGRLEGSRSFWINNSIALRVTEPLLRELAEHQAIERIDFDEPVFFAEESGLDAVQSAEWGLTMIRADLVWSTYGFDGTGIVVGSMDTGFDPTHPALVGKWRGGTNSWTDIINGQPNPYDDHGHGSHTIGTMVGGDGAGPSADDIGVAYNARFISAKVLDQFNSFSSASIVISGAQWMLDPDGNALTDDFPEVINNSWLFFTATYTGFHSTVAAWRSAGIIPVFCIGNNGPGASTTRPPGNYNNTIGVGAVDASDVIASFSSRGPSPAGAAFPADQRKPELSAPGDLVRSSVPGGTYQSWSGTSMASPHVAGTVALMLQGNPALIYDDIRTKLIDSAADLGAVGYDHNYGYGRIDAFDAVTDAVTDVPTLPGAAGPRLFLAPNPFRDQVRLTFSGGTEAARIEIFDLQGRRIWSASPGSPTGALIWNGRDASGGVIPPGIFLVRFSDAGNATTRRILHLR